MTRPIIQIAGVLNLNEVLMLAECGVTDIGFPLRLDVHEEDMDETLAAEVIAALPRNIRSVLITYLKDPAEITALGDTIGAQVVQLHGDVPPSCLAEVKRLRPALPIIKSLVVRAGNGAELEAAALAYAPYADAFLTDTFDPGTGASGATGMIHDWSVSRRLAEISPRPLILAGGLNPDNVRQAVNTVRPAGVDAHSGVEDPAGNKDRRLVERFVQEARAGFADIDPRN